MVAQHKNIWTIGHSTRQQEVFINMLHSFKIKTLVDIRSLPGSRKFPQFNKEVLALSLPGNHINYLHLSALGGRRKVNKDSKNTVWRVSSFQGYADYMETEAFTNGILALEKIADENRTAFMCSEALWWRCHRSMVADYLKLAGWQVLHIIGVGKVEEHPYTEPARIVGGKLTYAVNMY